MISNLPFHPLAELFPLMNGAEYEGLKADIAEHGQLEVIVTLDGAILDGRNRYRACQELSLEPKLIEWSGVGSPQAFVVSHNLHRRHLNESQRAMIAARLATRTKEESALQATAVRMNRKAGHNVPEISGTLVPTIVEAAELLNVNDKTVSDAKTVLSKGTPDEIEAVDRGDAAVSSIAKNIRADMAPDLRELKRKNPQADRQSTKQEQAQLWALYRDALKNLTSLPSTDDMTRIVRSHDKAKMTSTKLSIALNWLTEFSEAWNKE